MSQLRHSQIAPMVLHQELYNGPYESESIEAAWASEAIAFVYVSDIQPDASLNLRVQVSGNGIQWINFGPQFDIITQNGGYFLQLKHFGTFLRLAGEVKGAKTDKAVLVLAFYWDFKE